MQNPTVVKKNRQGLGSITPTRTVPTVTAQEGQEGSEAENAEIVRWLEKNKLYGSEADFLAHLAAEGVF
jgi:hypothetical protein